MLDTFIGIIINAIIYTSDVLISKCSQPHIFPFRSGVMSPTDNLFSPASSILVKGKGRKSLFKNKANKPKYGGYENRAGFK